MKKSYLLAGLVLFSSIAAAEEISLDTIRVESSTIEDIATDKRTESSTVNIIDEETIEKIDPKNINELLQTVPGITADLRNGDIVEIHIRGIAQQEFMWEDTGVAIVIDGVPVLQNGGKVKFNLDEIESIKVIKGSASYLYGQNALAGAVIITTKKIKDKNGFEVKAEAGSEEYKNIKANVYKGTEAYSFNIGANYRYDGGYWDRTENETKSVNGKFQYYIDDMSDITVGVDITRKYEESDRGSVTGVTAAETNPTGTDGDWPWNHDYYTDLDKYFITYSKDFDNGANLKINSYYYKDLYDYESTPYDNTGDGNDDYYAKDNNEDIKQYGVKTEFRGKKDKLAYMIGVDLGKRKSEDYSYTKKDYTDSRGYDQYAGEWEDELLTENNYGVYGETKYKITNNFTTTINLRYDINRYKYEENAYSFSSRSSSWEYDSFDETKTYRNTTYRAGGAYNINKNNTLYANISTGFRNPRIKELYNGELGWGSAENNFDLKTEKTITYEVGMKGTTFLKAEYEASIFVTDTKDIISKVDGTYNWDSDFYDNVGDARNRGFELSLKGKAKEKFSYSIAYTYLDAYYTSHLPFTVDIYADADNDGKDDDNGENITYDITGNQLPRVPHHKIDLIVNYKFLPKWNLMTELYAQSKYYADETNLITMPGYGKVNMRVDYKPIKNLEFFVKIDNILDKQYYRTVYLYSDKNKDGKFDAEDASITVDPGRVFYAGLKYRF
ncbi:TonB-dependent receptor [Hydrogenimonas thermophila]|uniref:Iron complex outermembrane recepter protein n=1 Tax=Hydrogenimonas thermophila TaxID=223786 RepID=A0A1I5M5M3_9BACT|nr:TonB-dependent receptor [Hydrogenimonas thermophila]SFP04904.1 iron complex outermembrane recepter protein [Hydrogenimonas thermophila]